MVKPPKNIASDHRGASVSRVTQSDQLRAWAVQHRESAVNSLKQLLAMPLQSVMTWLVIAIALALPAALSLVVSHIKTLGEEWQVDPKMTVYLRQSLPDAAIADVGQRLHKLPGLLSAEYISPQQGLEEFSRQGGFGEALSLLSENPLPPVYVLRATESEGKFFQDLMTQLETFPEVEKVQLDLQWVKRLQSVIALIERAVLMLGFFLSLGVLLTISNVTRLAIERRREEISVLKLVGATDAFVRRPLLYTGLWYGLVGGLIAWMLLMLAAAVMAPAVQELLSAYQSDRVLEGAGFETPFQLLGVGGVLGLLGAWWAASRHLKATHPA